MHNNKKYNWSSAIGETLEGIVKILIIVAIMFIIGKIIHVSYWLWLWVLLPLWVILMLIIIILIGSVLYNIIYNINYKRKQKKQRRLNT